MARFSKSNQQVKCVDCGKMTAVNVRGVVGPDLCGDCQDKAGLENEHLDGEHEPGSVHDCPLCTAKRAIVADFQTAHANEKAKTLGSWDPKNNPFRVLRVSRGGIHGWDTQAVTCSTLEEGRALASSAAKLPHTVRVEIDRVEGEGQAWTWVPVERIQVETKKRRVG